MFLTVLREGQLSGCPTLVAVLVVGAFSLVVITCNIQRHRASFRCSGDRVEHFLFPECSANTPA